MKQATITEPYLSGWIPGGEYSVLGYTVIGSHIWDMAHDGSDIDTYAVVQQPTSLVLRGKADLMHRSLFKSHTDHDWPVDIHIHEAQRIVTFLESGNINAIVGVMSPIVLRSAPAFENLRRIVQDNRTRQVYHSARGMALSNWKRYKLEGSMGREVMEPHRARKLLRALEFATRICSGEPITFRPPEGETTAEGVGRALASLEDAYKYGGMPDSAGEVYRDWLEEVRMDELERAKGDTT